MNTLAEIQSAIVHLSAKEQRQLARWFEEELEDAWDAQIEEDSKSGRLDHLYDQLTKADDEDAAVPLDDFLNDAKLS